VCGYQVVLTDRVASGSLSNCVLPAGRLSAPSFLVREMFDAATLAPGCSSTAGVLRAPHESSLRCCCGSQSAVFAATLSPSYGGDDRVRVRELFLGWAQFRSELILVAPGHGLFRIFVSCREVADVDFASMAE